MFYRTLCVIIVAMPVRCVSMSMDPSVKKKSCVSLAERRKIRVASVDVTKKRYEPGDDINEKTAHFLEGETPVHLRTRVIAPEQKEESEKHSFAELQEIIWQKSLKDYDVYEVRRWRALRKALEDDDMRESLRDYVVQKFLEYGVLQEDLKGDVLQKALNDDFLQGVLGDYVLSHMKNIQVECNNTPLEPTWGECCLCYASLGVLLVCCGGCYGYICGW